MATNDQAMYVKIGSALNVQFSKEGFYFRKDGTRVENKGQVGFFQGDARIYMTYKEYLDLIKLAEQNEDIKKRVVEMLEIERKRTEVDAWSLPFAKEESEKPAIEVSSVPKEYRKSAKASE